MLDFSQNGDDFSQNGGEMHLSDTEEGVDGEDSLLVCEDEGEECVDICAESSMEISAFNQHLRS